MLLSICISINAWLLVVIVSRFWIPCLEDLTWSLLLTLFSTSLLSTMFVHIYHWKCWKYLLVNHHCLRSLIGTNQKNIRYCVSFTLFLWLVSSTFVVGSWFCWKQLYPLVFLIFVPTVIYTAFCCSSCSSSCGRPSSCWCSSFCCSSSELESSSVNASFSSELSV